MPLRRLSLADLDLDEAANHLSVSGQPELADDIPHVLRAWRLYDGEHPTVAGILLFGRRPQEALPQARIVAVSFPGVDSSEDPSDQMELTGRLFDVIDKANSFLNLHLRAPHRIRGFEPERYPELPEAACREAVVNALVHRDYTIAAPVRIFVLADRVEFHTPGKPPNTVDVDAMRSGIHVVRNPHLYTRVARAGLATDAGTGIPRISRLVREATGQDIGLEIRGDHEVLLTMPRRGS
ncbi:MAG: ATP-binding protein [Streptosporangiaceae bacterium]